MEGNRSNQTWVRQNPKTTPLHLCKFCPHSPVFQSTDELSEHLRTRHQDCSQAQQGPAPNWHIWDMTAQVAPPRSPEGLERVAEDINQGIVALKSQCKASQPDQKLQLYKDLLDEYCDFFHVSQLPSMNTAQQELAYNMQNEMWTECIYPGLEIQRRLPVPPDFNTNFIAYAYEKLSGLYDMVPIHRETWTQYLGHLSWQRVTTEDNLEFRKTLVKVAIKWYSEAIDRGPRVGQRYMNLANTSPDVLKKLFYYSKALCTVPPYLPARDSILSLFEHDKQNLPTPATALLKAYCVILTNQKIEEVQSTIREFTGLLSNHIRRRTNAVTRDSVYIAISNITAMLGFGSKQNTLIHPLFSSEPVSEIAGTTKDSPDHSSPGAEMLANETTKIFLQEIEEQSLLPFIHIILVFIDFMCGLDRPHRLIIRYLTINFRCSRLVEILNTLLASYSQTDSIRSTGFPEDHHLLTEDRAIRGLLWAEKYYPPSWFTDKMIADEQRPREDAVSILERKCRILWLAFRIADKRLWIYYNEEACRFSLLELPPLDAGIDLPTRLVGS
jgi:hypothetical protein